ncbi:MAG: hypothetical protein K2K75_03165 [Muribaculaceae bacterium]|nr:hypothetical protein [Muribaculaceae bacterium]
MDQNSLVAYDEAAVDASYKSSKFTEIFRNARNVACLVENMPNITQGIKEIRLAQIESRRHLESLRLLSDRNLHKFDRIIQGAERRLDRQLDEMKEIRQVMRQFNISSLSSIELSIISKLNEQIDMINSNVMYELKMLYNL